MFVSNYERGCDRSSNFVTLFYIIRETFDSDVRVPYGNVITVYLPTYWPFFLTRWDGQFALFLLYVTLVRYAYLGGRGANALAGAGVNGKLA